MSDTLLREKNQITLPGDIVQSAGLSPSDRIACRFEGGEIIGRKLEGAKGQRIQVGSFGERFLDALAGRCGAGK